MSTTFDAPPEPPYGPGAICDECGHFAGRHTGLTCAFPREPPKQPCDCKGMLWLMVRWEMDPRTGPIRAVAG